jgi:hypothetical protein
MGKKLLVIGLEICLLCVVLVVGANIWYSNPKHCVSCHEVKKNFDSWKISSHSSVNCLECHQDKGFKGMMESKARGIFRVLLHFSGMSPSEIKAVVARERCWQCHTQLRKKYRVGSMANLSDTHSIHLNKGYNCTDCHAEAVHPDNLLESGMPKMIACITCHEQEKVTTECGVCHLDVQRHQSVIADLGGLPLSEQGSCATCHPLVKMYDNKISHKVAIDNVGGWKGSNAVCNQCHPRQAKDMEHTVHARLKSEVKKIKDVKGQQGLITRYCAYCGGNAELNWADAIETQGKRVSIGCGKCHVGGASVEKIPSSEIDCLVCHSEKYDMTKKTVVQDDGRIHWTRDTAEETAYAVGRPLASHCKRCHEDYMTHYRGTPFTKETDAHAAMGMDCIQCHTIVNHKVARGSYVTDLWANDLPAVAHSCIQCHMNRRHQNNYINIHLQKIACETCHVKKAGGLLSRDWTEPQLDKEKGLYQPATVTQEEIKPIFAWFNGEIESSTKPVGARDDRNAKIYPFKMITSSVPVNPATGEPLPIKLSVYHQTGDVTASIEAAMQELNLSWDKRWKKGNIPATSAYIQLSHSVSDKGRACDECHSENGVIDFKTLGYTDEQIKMLRKSVDNKSL